VEVIRANLTGAKYTLAVPAYTYNAGLRSFADIQHYATQLNKLDLRIESGNDGNRLVLGMLRQNLFGLGTFNWSSRASRECWRRSNAPSATTRRSCFSPGTRTR